MALITLLTDFGGSDSFVGEMKGAILSIDPTIRIVDLAHGVAAGNVREGAWVLSRTWDAFPPETCHLAVVDPGVGSERRAIAVRTADRWFVGPDNGLLMSAVDAANGAREIREVAVRELDRPRRGTTFDGRDLFAPVAARLVTGAEFAQLGPEVHDPVGVGSFRPKPSGDMFEAEIIRTDRFGNLVTTADEAFLRSTFGEDWRRIRVHAGDTSLEGVLLGYAERPAGEALLTIGGAGTLEISVNRGSARKKLGLAAGDFVSLEGPE